jgi:AAA+ ATPase superfamily predicted ATPase
MIGRTEEQYELNRLYEKKQSDFAVIYGRRRIGKTYLVNNVFRGRYAFHHTGLPPYNEKGIKVTLKDQLESFYLSLQLFGMKKSARPKSWLEAFFMLKKLLQDKDDGSKQVVFIDELPWMDMKRSNFLPAFEEFYNGWCSERGNVLLIVCGSANSWIQKNLILNSGGLHNRLTYQKKLLPFTLGECEEYLADQNVQFSRYDIVQSYMLFGGIPYYLSYMDGRFSLPQNVDRLLFNENPILKDEYDNLFKSSFDHPEKAKEIIEYLYSKNIGYTRSELTRKFSDISGSTLTDILDTLEKSDFLIRYIPFSSGKREEKYRLTDPYCLSYLSFLKDNKARENFWQYNMNASSLNTWRGFAFENVCYRHFKQILKALGILGVEATQSIWIKAKDADSEGTQIDLIIERADHVVNLCELKFYSDEYVVDAGYEKKMRTRASLVSELVSPKKVVRNTLITTYGLKRNPYSGVFTNVITLEDLFE